MWDTVVGNFVHGVRVFIAVLAHKCNDKVILLYFEYAGVKKISVSGLAQRFSNHLSTSLHPWSSSHTELLFLTITGEQITGEDADTGQHIPTGQHVIYSQQLALSGSQHFDNLAGGVDDPNHTCPIC